MKTSELLHFAFRARDPLALGRWYAELFEGQFFVHPVMSALGIVVVKFNHPEAVFDGLVGILAVGLRMGRRSAVFRRIDVRSRRRRPTVMRRSRSWPMPRQSPPSSTAAAFPIAWSRGRWAF